MDKPESKPEAPKPQPLSLGRIVLYCFNDSHGNPVERPAIVVKVYSETCGSLQVFTNGEGDGVDQAGGVWHRPSVGGGGSSPRLGEWRWPPRV